MTASEPQPRNVVVFAGSPHGPAMVEHVEAVADAFPHWHVTVVQQYPRRPSWPHFVRAKLRRFGREPVSYPLELAGQAWNRLRRRHRRRTTAGNVGLPVDFNGIDRPNIAFHACESLHDAATLALVRNLDPWLGVAIGAPILKRTLYAVPHQGTVNLHKSLLPAYRGMPPGFWELHDGVETTGATVHWVDDRLDAGAIVFQRALPIAPFATAGGLAAELDRHATDVLIESLRRLDGGQVGGAAPRQPASPPSRRPPWRLARAVHRRLERRRRAPGSVFRILRSIAKYAVLAGYVYLWAPVRNRVRAAGGGCHATVLLYHRVSDGFLDSITVGVEQFWRHLELLRCQYNVVDLPAFLASRGKPRRQPCVVITFDDGYADNYLAAALLRRAGLPATYFVSTSIVGNERAFPHDLDQLGRRVEPLSWDQVRRMSDWGFHFANHTATHARLSALPVDEAVEEVRSAERTLDREQGRDGLPRCLAYPYGRESDITDEVQASLPDVGIDYCLSAYGGVNPPDFDPMNIVRQGIDAGFSDIAFRAALEGWQSKA